jgi:Mn2+/Fe2+ NRAMP family transporter
MAQQIVKPTGAQDDTLRAVRPWWRRRAVLGLLALWGPGLVVMLADTDAGSLITASQSGARFGYAMVLPLLALIPILYLVQETALRLGLVTGQGHGALIRARFGRRWALLSAGALLASVFGALLTEYAGVAGVGLLFGIQPRASVPPATLFLLGLALTGSYRRVERVALALGLAELAFLAALVMARPGPGALARGLGSVPLGQGSYLVLLAANIGAVIMPWMVFYQQSAVVDKGLTPAALRRARQDTAFGAVLTQLIMIAAVATVAATLGTRHPGASLTTVGEISGALTPYLGALGGRVLFGLGMLGAALIAALVASLAGAWALSEVFGWRHTLNQRPDRATWKFYLSYALAHLTAAAVVLTGTALVRLAVAVEVINALLLPIVLGLLLALEARTLPARWRIRGPRKYLTWASYVLITLLGLAAVPALLDWI